VAPERSEAAGGYQGTTLGRRGRGGQAVAQERGFWKRQVAFKLAENQTCLPGPRTSYDEIDRPAREDGRGGRSQGGEASSRALGWPDLLEHVDRTLELRCAGVDLGQGEVGGDWGIDGGGSGGGGYGGLGGRAD
jgi:hypothetical protein